MRKTSYVKLLALLGLLAFLEPVAAQIHGKIVFSQGTTGNELWVVNDDGSNPHKLLTASSYIVSPRWSRDGSQIAFQSGTLLWVGNADGSNLHTLSGVFVADSELTWDSLGTGFVYARVCVCCEHLRAVNADGSNDRLFFNPGGVIQTPDARPGDAVPSSLVAYFKFQCGGEFSPQFFGLEKVRESGANFMQIPGSSDINRQQIPRWSDDGNLLVTSVRIAANNHWAIEIFDPFNVSQPRNRFLQGPDNFSSLDFGCRADRVYFSRGTDGFRNIQRVNTDGTNLTTITNFSSGLLRDLDFYCTEIPVGIDIKPGSFPNSINLGSHGTVPVAILSSATFDAATVDPATVMLAGTHVATKGRGLPMASLEDVNGDGRLDLVMHFITADLQLIVGDTAAVLEGSTLAGTAVRGSDAVRIVP